MTQKILADIVNHPNAGAVLVISLGCENNNLTELKKFLVITILTVLNF